MSSARAIDEFIAAVDKLSDVTIIEPSTYCNMTITDGVMSSWCPNHVKRPVLDADFTIVTDYRAPFAHTTKPSVLLNDLLNHGGMINAERVKANIIPFDFPLGINLTMLNITFSHPKRNDCIYSYDIRHDKFQPFFEKTRCAECDKLFGLTVQPSKTGKQ